MNDSNIQKSIDSRIDKAKEKRIALGISQKQIADKIGVNRVAIINVEKPAPKRIYLKYDKAVLLFHELGVKWVSHHFTS